MQMAMMLEISSSDQAEIAARALASPEAEVCGLLLGEGMRVAEVWHCANVAPDPRTAFEVDPRALVAAYRDARGGAAAVIGHYHSHPRGPATPSPRDAAASRGGEVWLIVADGIARAWLARGQGDFIEIGVAATGTATCAPAPQPPEDPQQQGRSRSP